MVYIILYRQLDFFDFLYNIIMIKIINLLIILKNLIPYHIFYIIKLNDKIRDFFMTNMLYLTIYIKFHDSILILLKIICNKDVQIGLSLN